MSKKSPHGGNNDEKQIENIGQGEEWRPERDGWPFGELLDLLRPPVVAWVHHRCDLEPRAPPALSRPF